MEGLFIASESLLTVADFPYGCPWPACKMHSDWKCSQKTPKRVRAANSKNSDPPAKPSALSEIYFDARAPPVTASRVARAWPSAAPKDTPASAQHVHHPLALKLCNNVYAYPTEMNIPVSSWEQAHVSPSGE